MPGYSLYTSIHIALCISRGECGGGGVCECGGECGDEGDTLSRSQVTEDALTYFRRHKGGLNIYEEFTPRASCQTPSLTSASSHIRVRESG